MNAYKQWCELNGLSPFPAVPYHIARFIRETACPDLSQVWGSVREVGHAHVTVGLADPTAGGAVQKAMNDLSRIAPPRGWSKEEQGRFQELPFDLQVMLHEREKQRESDAARLLRENAELRKANGKEDNGIQQTAA